MIIILLPMFIIIIIILLSFTTQIHEEPSMCTHFTTQLFKYLQDLSAIAHNFLSLICGPAV